MPLNGGLISHLSHLLNKCTLPWETLGPQNHEFSLKLQYTTNARKLKCETVNNSNI